MNKKEIIENEMENYVKNEKKIMEDTYHPFIVRLEKTFKDDDYINMDLLTFFSKRLKHIQSFIIMRSIEKMAKEKNPNDHPSI